MANHQKQSKLVKNIAKVGIAAAIVGTPAVVAAAPASATNWDAVAQCESGGNWSTDTGNGYSGGLQFTQSTWDANGGTGSPENASRAEQIKVAERVKQSQGMSAWPVCGSQGGSSSSSSDESASSSSSSDDASSSYQSSQSSDEDSSATSSSDESPSYSSSAETSSSSDEGSSSSSGSGSYTVQSGDTLSKIASSQGVSGGWHELYELNQSKLSSPNVLTPGQTLELSS